MNLALVLRRFARDGGVERYAVNLAGFLESRGHEVHVYACGFGPDLPGIQHRWPSMGRGVVGQLRFQRLLRRVRGHDVVQCFDRALGADVFRCGGGVHAEWLARRDTTAIRRLFAAVSVTDRLECWLDRRAFQGARRVVTNSELVRRQVLARFPVDPSAVRVVRNGVEADRFHPGSVRREQARKAWGVRGRVALFFASAFRRKGLATAARAFRHVARAEDSFVVMGRDRHAKRHLAPVRGLLGEQLIVHGPEPSPERWLPGADLTVLPTRYDAAANTTLEALASGVPPVTTSHDGNAEVVPDRRLVVDDPSDWRAVAAAMQIAWDGGGRLRDACRTEALRWPVSRNGVAMESIYGELIDG